MKALIYNAYDAMTATERNNQLTEVSSLVMLVHHDHILPCCLRMDTF